MNQDTNIVVNSKVLIWARETIALNLNQVSEKSGINSKRLSQLEKGEKLPTLEELKVFSKVYKRTLATLLLKDPPVEKPLPKDRRTIDSAQIGNFHEKTIVAIRKARALSNSLIELKKDAGIDLPVFRYKGELSNNPKDVAATIRRDLNLDEIRAIENSNLALEFYIERVESSGVAVFQMSLTQDGLRGFCITDESIPIIGLKRGGEPSTAKIFTLFHELGHVVLREGSLCDLSDSTDILIEKWCNAFAAEIVLPQSELLSNPIVLKQLKTGQILWSKKDLITIGSVFHVGPLVVLRALLENKLTTSEFYNSKHISWNKPQFGRAKNPEGRNIAKETIKEKGKTYVSLAFSAYDKNRIDLKDLSDFLGVKLSYLSKTRQLLKA